jgi:peptide/nickel transport system substrate-binding protein
MLVNTVLGGYGIPITSPIPPGFGIDVVEEAQGENGESRVEQAHAILRDAGWKLNTESGIWEKNIDETLTPLAFSIATVNNPIFEATAEYLRAAWEKIGISVTVKQFEQSDLTQAIIRPRDYESLLFGTQVGRSFDYYSFWHSSQRNDPGLNIALYANITTDSILSQARTSTNTENRNEALRKFAEELKKENPAIFIYTPELIYIFPNRVIGASFAGVSEPHERFSSVHEWYIHTESVWPIFKNEDADTNSIQ